MMGDAVPDAEHVLRYVGGRHIEAGSDGTVVITGGGFIAKPKDDNRPSCNWLECIGGSLEERVQFVRDVARLSLGATAMFAQLKVETIRRYIAENTEDFRAVTVIQDPLEALNDWPSDPSHALMTNIPDENDPQGELVGDLIAECVIALFPARFATPS